MTLNERGRKGGRVRASESSAKRRALRRLHNARRGRRINTGGVTDRERETTLCDIMAAVREPIRGRVSIRAAAAAIRTSDRTVRRWLTGEDWPPSTKIKALQKWLRSTK
jgi:hypothetical protein